MQLFAAPRACSFGAHVVIRELDLPVDVTLVTLNDAASALHAVNPQGRVPALRLDDGTVLTENSAILPFLADLVPGTSLFAPPGSVERAQIQSWIAYIATELHAGSMRPFNRPHLFSADAAAHDGIRAASLGRLKAALLPLETRLAWHGFLVGNRFTIADAYFGNFAGLARVLGGELAEFEALHAYSQHYEARASVQAARAFEAERVPV